MTLGGLATRMFGIRIEDSTQDTFLAFDLRDIREERPEDVATIRDVNLCAFGQDQEGNIVDALRSNGAALLSLVATLNHVKMQGISGLAKYRHEFSSVV